MKEGLYLQQGSSVNVNALKFVTKGWCGNRNLSADYWALDQAQLNTKNQQI